MFVKCFHDLMELKLLSIFPSVAVTVLRILELSLRQRGSLPPGASGFRMAPVVLEHLPV